MVWKPSSFLWQLQSKPARVVVRPAGCAPANHACIHGAVIMGIVHMVLGPCPHFNCKAIYASKDEIQTRGWHRICFPEATAFVKPCLNDNLLARLETCRYIGAVDGGIPPRIGGECMLTLSASN